MTQSNLPFGLRPSGAPRTGVSGAWWRALGPDGTERGVLRLDPVATLPGAVERVAAVVRAVNALQHAGLLATGEPVRHGGEFWLVATEPAGPTLVELTQAGGNGLDSGGLATIASETARALLALHAGGLVHGALHGQTVIVTAGGLVKLAEAGLAPALRPTAPDPMAADRWAWAELVRWLAGQWGVPAPTAEVLSRCATLGERDLAGAVRLLQSGGPLPAPAPGHQAGPAAAVALYRATYRTGAGSNEHTQTRTVTTDDGLTQAVPTQAVPVRDAQTWGSSTPTGGLSTQHAQTGATPTDEGATQAVATDAAATQIVGTERRPGLSTPTGHQPPPVAGTLSATAPGTRGTWPEAASTGWRQPTAPPPGGELRFGPGVPAATPTVPGWHPPPAARQRRSPWRLARTALSALLTLALLAVAGFYLWQRINPLEISSVEVAVPDPPGNRCDVTVDVVATVRTNGNAGTISYQWLRKGAAPGSLLTERVGRGQRSVPLHLKWSFAGVGTTRETATINITAPATVQAETSFSYDCRQR